MKIEKDTVVTLTARIQNAQGKVLEDGKTARAYLHGGYGNTPPGIKVGGQLEGSDEQGRRHLFTVMKIKGNTVHLDGNHPLAGEDLTITLKVLDVRAASPEEVQHGHAHGAHGHHH
jgi:FKBP-type peptidyl-prolyl cis-trans isomerase SlyD